MSRLLVVVIGAFFLPALFASSAHAQESDAAIFGALDYEDEETGEDVPVTGVTIEVEGVGTTETDENGEFRLVVPEPGDYVVALAEDTLPEGLNLRNPENNPLDTTVSENRDRRVLFPLVAGEVEEDSGGSISFTVNAPRNSDAHW